MKFTTNSVIKALINNDDDHMKQFLKEINNKNKPDIDYEALYQFLIDQKHKNGLMNNLLGRLYNHGLGTKNGKEDSKKALKYYQLAANQNNASAQVGLGEIAFIHFQQKIEFVHQQINGMGCFFIERRYHQMIWNGYLVIYTDKDYCNGTAGGIWRKKWFDCFFINRFIENN